MGTGPRKRNSPFETLASCAAGLERRVRPGSLIARGKVCWHTAVGEREIGEKKFGGAKRVSRAKLRSRTENESLVNLSRLPSDRY